jgi:light-regulated signal transduction histidine kinase (bacteriophytochrome)
VVAPAWRQVPAAAPCEDLMERPIAGVGEAGADLGICDREPIHLSGSIQPHGALFVLAADGGIRRAAIGSTALPWSGRDVLGRRLPDLFPEQADWWRNLTGRIPARGTCFLGVLTHGGVRFQVVAHRAGDESVVELEESAAGEPAAFDEVYPQLRDFLDKVQFASTVDDLARLAAEEVRRITGLDRALVYRFDPLWNGEVIAEDRTERLPSYLGLRFPASDIPSQARELYRLNRLRLIADAAYTPVPIQPASGPEAEAPLDLSGSILRSVSPVHLEYMRNMGTLASMSISLMRGDRLWGLISCHNAAPHRVPYHVRNACDFIGQVLSLQLTALESATLSEQRHQLRRVQTRLLAHMAAADHFISGLREHGDDLLALTGASGAAIVFDGRYDLIGTTPDRARVARIVDWLSGQQKKDLVVTDSLSTLMPDAERIKDSASGLLVISISQLHDSFVIWFRPEVISTISWGGDPRKPPADAATMRIHPRKSFETWRETVQLQSRPWHQAEIDAANELRTAIVDIVLRKAEEMAALSERLTASNRELESFSYSVSHDLRAPFRHIVGYAQLLKKFEGSKLSDKGNRYIDTIVESAVSAGTLVDNLLSFSQMGRSTLRLAQVDLDELVADVRARLSVDVQGRKITWKVGPLPPARADVMMLRLVFQNLIENAIKFTRPRDPAVIEIGWRPGDGAYFVRDNGTGFDMAYVGKLFGVFQRLHRVEEFEGTGIGLANVKRIVERHHGTVWAEGALDQGATFFFTLPSQDH